MWLKTDDGALVNLDHISTLDLRDGGLGSVCVVARWSGTDVIIYLSSHDDEDEATKRLTMIEDAIINDFKILY